jgi:hypothetical protein
MKKDRSESKKANSPRWMRIGCVIAGVASMSGFAFMVGKAITMVKSGHGLDTYRTFWLAEDSWIGFLVFVGAAIIALALGPLFQWSERRKWRELERKYGGGPGGA